MQKIHYIYYRQHIKNNAYFVHIFVKKQFNGISVLRTCIMYKCRTTKANNKPNKTKPLLNGIVLDVVACSRAAQKVIVKVWDYYMYIPKLSSIRKCLMGVPIVQTYTNGDLFLLTNS